MRENIDYTWLQHDINILRHILKEKHYTETYSEVLINNLIKMFEDSSLEEITPPLVRNAFIYDIGRDESNMIANHFDQMRATGRYEHELQKLAKERGYNKD
jgi:transposase